RDGRHAAGGHGAPAEPEAHRDDAVDPGDPRAIPGDPEVLRAELAQPVVRAIGREPEALREQREQRFVLRRSRRTDLVVRGHRAANYTPAALASRRVRTAGPTGSRLP